MIYEKVGNKLKTLCDKVEFCTKNQKKYFTFLENNTIHNILLQGEINTPCFIEAVMHNKKDAGNYKIHLYKQINSQKKPFDFYERTIVFVVDKTKYTVSKRKNFIIIRPDKYLCITPHEKRLMVATSLVKLNKKTFAEAVITANIEKGQKKSYAGCIIREINYKDAFKYIEKHMKLSEFFKNINKKRFKGKGKKDTETDINIISEELNNIKFINIF